MQEVATFGFLLWGLTGPDEDRQSRRPRLLPGDSIIYLTVDETTVGRKHPGRRQPAHSHVGDDGSIEAAASALSYAPSGHSGCLAPRHALCDPLHARADIEAEDTDGAGGAVVGWGVQYGEPTPTAFELQWGFQLKGKWTLYQPTMGECQRTEPRKVGKPKDNVGEKWACRLPSLEPGKKYVVRVRGCNAKGARPACPAQPSSPLGLTALRAPPGR